MFALSAPFWIFGALVSSQLLPGLPVSAVMAITPALAAGILVYRSGAGSALKLLLARAVDAARMRPWAWLVAIGTMPMIVAGSGLILVAAGTQLPAPEIQPLSLAALFALFLVAATAEELGWTAYAAGPLIRTRGLLVAALLLGSISVVWHLIPLLQVDRDWYWISWWALGTLTRRVIIVWLYARGGQSVFSTSLFHAMNNVSWMMFPVMGSHYDPVTTALISTALALLIALREGNSTRLD